MKEIWPVVIFGDYIAAYGAIRGLSKNNIPIYMVSAFGTGLSLKSRYVKKSIVLHHSDNNFISKLDSWIKEEIGDKAILMVAGEDQYLDILSKKYLELSGDIRVTFPEWEIVKLVREKRYTYEIAEKIGIPVPKTLYISSKEQLIKLNEDKLMFPVLMKPEDSVLFLKQYGNKGVVCNNFDELLENYNKYDGFNGSLLLQEFIPGEESRLYSAVIVLNRNSKPPWFDDEF